MNLDDTNYQRFLAPIDWENQTLKFHIDKKVDDKSSFDTDHDVEEKEEHEKWLSWVNSEIFWELLEKPELLLEIFTRLSPKSVLKFKCLSKYFLDLSNQHYFLRKQFENKRESVTGFFGQRSLSKEDHVNPHDFNKIEYINIKSKFDSLPDPGLNFLKQRTRICDTVRLIDSCNGLLLCTHIKSTTKTCFVCNPLTKEKVALPHRIQRATRVNHALIADLNEEGKFKFKVVCLFRAKGRCNLGTEMLIFSSRTGTWEEIQLEFPYMEDLYETCDWEEEIKPEFPPMHHATRMGSKVFYNGSLYWDCFENYILVCHLNDQNSGRCYDFIEAPRASLGRCLWKYHDKLLCYCHGYEGDFPSWSLSTKENGEFEWKIEGPEQFEMMSDDISRTNCYNNSMLINNSFHNLPQVRFKIIAYDPFLDIVYILRKDIIFSYQLCSRRVEIVWQLESRTFVFAYRHRLSQTESPKMGEIKAEEEEKECDTTVKDTLLESIDEKQDDDVLSMYENCANKVRPRRRKGKGKIVEHKAKGSEKGKEEIYYDENCENKVRQRRGKAKINFSLLQLDEDQ